MCKSIEEVQQAYLCSFNQLNSYFVSLWLLLTLSMLKLTDVSQTAQFAASSHILVSVMLPKTNNTVVYRDEKRMVVLCKKKCSRLPVCQRLNTNTHSKVNHSTCRNYSVVSMQSAVELHWGYTEIPKGRDYRTRNSCMQDQAINSKFGDQPRPIDQFTLRTSSLLPFSLH